VSGMTPDEERAAYRVLFTKVLGHRDMSAGPYPRRQPERAAEYDRVPEALGVERGSQFLSDRTHRTGRMSLLR
jgi:hypothetical protein